MTIQTIHQFRPFVRLAARLRRGALVVALVGAAAPGAMGAPVTLSYPVDLFPQEIPKFNTTLGTLLGIDISLSSVLGSSNPFVNQVPQGDPCSVVFAGASLAVSAPGTPTLLTLDGTGSTSAACGTHEFGVSKQGAATVDPSHFGAFTSVGFTPFTMIVTLTFGTATVTHGTETRAGDPFWHPGLTRGSLTYTYCPVGEQCDTPPPPPPPSPVPEPTTMVMLTLGLAGMLARRARADR